MKCISCGAEIGLTDKICPHCGRVIGETAGYQADLENVKQSSEKTQGRMQKSVRGNVPLVISTAVLILLVIAVCVASYVKKNAYHFRDDAMRKEAIKNSDEYSVQIKKYLDAGDYTAFVAFKDYHNIAEYAEPYDDLKLLWEMAYDYNSMISNIEEAVIHGPEARWYRPENDVFDCRMAISEFYREYEYKLSEIEKDPYAEYIHDMKNKADIVLRIYLGLDDEGREEYLAGSKNEQEAYLEEVIIGD